MLDEKYHTTKDGRNWLYCEDVELDWSQFSYRDYKRCEKEVLEPQLKKLRFKNFFWFNGESDSFGPLTRMGNMNDPEGRTVSFVYG